MESDTAAFDPEPPLAMSIRDMKADCGRCRWSVSVSIEPASTFALEPKVGMRLSTTAAVGLLSLLGGTEKSVDVFDRFGSSLG
jgi:hypothetical protein